MNNKLTTYLLLASVIFIWGFVGYKIYASIKDDNISSVKQDNIDIKNPIKADTFSLLLNYSDPFTKTTYHSIIPPSVLNSNKHASFNINKPVPIIQNFEKLNPINIKYFGLVKNESKKTGMLSINNKSYIVYEGQKIDSIKIISISKVELTYKYKKNKLSTISTK